MPHGLWARENTDFDPVRPERSRGTRRYVPRLRSGRTEGGPVIETERLTLRPWREGDVDEIMRVTNTPAVMEFLGGLQERDHFAGAADRMQAAQDKLGHCFWIVERREDK